MSGPSRMMAPTVPGDVASRPGDEVPEGTPGTGENTCPACGGSGTQAGQPCEACGGSGVVTVNIGDA